MTPDEIREFLTYGTRTAKLATVSADGRPIVGPVDGVFYRGAFHFGSSPDSVRFAASGSGISVTILKGGFAGETSRLRRRLLTLRNVFEIAVQEAFESDPWQVRRRELRSEHHIHVDAKSADRVVTLIQERLRRDGTHVAGRDGLRWRRADSRRQ